MFIENIERENLLKPLQIVIGIVEKKQPLPILSNVLIEKNESNLKMVATDLEIQISTNIHIQLFNKKEAITISARKFQEILKVLPEGNKVSLEVQENKVIIKSNKSKFNLQTLPPQDFPVDNNQIEILSKITLKQGLLKKLFGLVQYAMAQQDIRYYLNGVLLIVDENEIRLVATDGHRLAYTSSKLLNINSKFEVILSRKCVIELLKLLSDSDKELVLEIMEKQVRFIFEEIVLISKIIDGKFPDYERVIPNHVNCVTLHRITILQALQRVAILSNEKFRGVRFVLTEKNLRIISNNNEQEEAQEDIENDYHGPALDIGFNVNYLLDGLTNTSAETVTLSFGDPNSSLLITIPDEDQFKYVVMPMRI